MKLDNIIRSLKNSYPISDKSINRLIEHFTPHLFPKKETIIRGGQIDRNVYFIEKGITRSYCLIDGKEVTTWFSCEGDITFGLLDLYKNKPGFEYVETIEETLAYSIPIQALNELYKTDIDIANWSRVIHQDCLLALQCTRIDRLTLTAKERYEKLLELHPDICSRVNLGYIASYLGITLPTLSKIRAEF
ncbi:MAG: Crp/Fnr family transcriptional regulator [Bacteroidales bacterium]